MTTLELYRKHKKGEIGRDRFLYEVRRDNNLPWITNITSYDDAVKILKNKGIIREAQFEPQNIPTDPLVDRVNPYALKREVEKLLAKETELTNDSYKLALNKAAKKLTTPEAVKQAMFANAESVAKADAKLQTQEVKKNNHKDKANEMKKAKGQVTPKATAAPTGENKKTKKPKGVEVMKDKGVEGSEKVLREAALAELQSFLKKKLSLSEDVHYEYHVGSEVHLPEGGTGKIIEITGGTCTVEVADGSHRDIQMNVLGHAKKKAMEAEAAKTEVTDAITRSKWDPAHEESYNIKVGDTVEVQAPHRYQGLKGRVTSTDDNRIEVEFNQEDVNEIGAYDTVETFDADQLDKINDADSVNEVRDMGYIEGSELANKLVDTIEMYNELTPEQRQEEIDRLGMDLIPKLKAVFNDIMEKIHDESNYPAQEEDDLQEAVIQDDLQIGDRIKVIYGNEFYGMTGTIEDVKRGFVIVSIDEDGGEYSMHISDVEKIEDEEDLDEDLFTKGTGPQTQTIVATQPNTMSALKSAGFKQIPNTRDAK